MRQSWRHLLESQQRYSADGDACVQRFTEQRANVASEFSSVERRQAAGECPDRPAEASFSDGMTRAAIQNDTSTRIRPTIASRRRGSVLGLMTYCRLGPMLSHDAMGAR
jgi:hypothetical protein